MFHPYFIKIKLLLLQYISNFNFVSKCNTQKRLPPGQNVPVMKIHLFSHHPIPWFTYNTVVVHAPDHCVNEGAPSKVKCTCIIEMYHDSVCPNGYAWMIQRDVEQWTKYRVFPIANQKYPVECRCMQSLNYPHLQGSSCHTIITTM